MRVMLSLLSNIHYQAIELYSIHWQTAPGDILFSIAHNAKTLAGELNSDLKAILNECLSIYHLI